MRTKLNPRHHKIIFLVGILLFSSLLGSVYSSAAVQTNVSSLASVPSACPLSVFVVGQVQYIRDCYYEIGVNKATGLMSYAAITNGSNQSITSGAGLLIEELDSCCGFGGVGYFTSGVVSIMANTQSIVELGISGETMDSSGSTILTGTINMTFFANEPYFIASLSSTIEQSGPHIAHDFANFVTHTWSNAWVGPGNNGTTEVCTSAGCTHYTEPENTFDTNPDIRSLIQRDGPTWGWLGTSASTSNAEGIGFLLLGLNSTSPTEAAITHYEITQGEWEIEGTGIAPADPTSNSAAPHAIEYSANVPQTMYGAFLVYLNAAPYTTFESFINGFWKSASIGSYLGSSSQYAAFAFAGGSEQPNLNDNNWYITNLATSVSAPKISLQDAMIYFTGRNSSLANNFPMKMYLNLNGSTALDWNFGNPTATLLSNDGTNAKLQVVWNDPTDGLQLGMTFSTRSNSDKMNVTGYLEVTGNSLKVQTLSLQEDLFANYLDGSGLPSQYASSTNKLSWNYTNVGISILLPPSSGFVQESASQSTGNLYLVDSSSQTTFSKSTFSFSVSFNDPLSSFSSAYTENIYVPTVKLFTQPLGNASQVGFTEDNSRLFSYLESATQFYSNQTIARIQLLKPFTGDLEVYYAGSVNYLNVTFSNGTTEPASSFYNSQTKTFNFNVNSITWASLYGPSASTTLVSCSPGSVAIDSQTTCTATVTGNNATGVISWHSSISGTFSSNSCTLSSDSCSVNYSPKSSTSPVTINASYSGDANNVRSYGAYSLEVSPQLQSFVTISCSPTSISVGSSTTCTATVTGNSPTGTMTFSSNDTGARFSPSPSCTLSSGSCQVTYRSATSGSATIRASYSGDSNNAQNSSVTSLTVQASGKGPGFPTSIALIIGSAVVAVVIIGVSIFFKRRP